MVSKPLLPFLIVAACLMTAQAQEAFDAEKTKALFAGTDWYTCGGGWHSIVTFAADGALAVKVPVFPDKDRTGQWVPTGPRSVSGDKGEWVMSKDGSELHVTGRAGERNAFTVFYRGKKCPPEFQLFRATLAKPGIVWVLQGREKRTTLAFNGELDDAVGENGVEQKPSRGINVFGGGLFHLVRDDYGGLFWLTQDEKGEWVLRDWVKRVYKPEPAQPGDPLPAQRISRAKSSFGGTSWCRPDGKGKLLLLTFAANGTVSDSNFPNEKPEWIPYDNGSVRYTVKGGERRLKADADKKRLVREDDKVREIWFAGRTLPRVGMIETRQLKDTLADEAKVWIHWEASKKIIYTFDSKSGNVSITEDNGKPLIVRWEALCAGCIRIGDDAFMVEGDTLERIEPRLTLKQVTKDSLK